MAEEAISREPGKKFCVLTFPYYSVFQIAFQPGLSKCDPDLTTVGYMPLIQAPAHHLDTINTVVQRCMHISEKLGVIAYALHEIHGNR
jgi:hypothetical protein